MEDKIVTFLIIMFVLSQISERINNLLKLYMMPIWDSWTESLQAYLPIIPINRNSVTAQTDPKKFRHERRVFIWSLIGGALTTIIFFQLFLAESAISFSDDAEQAIGWMREIRPNWLFMLAVAVFLSFGAKFWHDILDLVFLIKNARRALTNPYIYQQGSINGIDRVLDQTQEQLVREALFRYREEIEKQPGIVATSLGYSASGEPLIRLRFDTVENAELGQKEFVIKDKYDQDRRIKVEKIVSGPALAQSAEIGGATFNQATVQTMGTLGCLFRDRRNPNQIYLVSCYHVVASLQNWISFSRQEHRTICYLDNSGQKKELGQLYYGVGPTVDAAITELNEGVNIDLDSMPEITNSGVVDLKSAGRSVEILGMKSKQVPAEIYEPIVSNVNIQYGLDRVATFDNLFTVKHRDHQQCPTQRGDSGSLVYAPDTGEALGMIIAGDHKYAYAVRITVIENLFGIRVLPKAVYKKTLRKHL